MSTVRLTLQLQGPQNPSVQVTATFSVEDVALLRKFTALVRRVREASLLVRGMPDVSRIKLEAGFGLTLTCAEYSDAELHELLHVLRPLILQEEPTSFHRITSRLKRTILQADVRAYLDLQSRVFKDGELRMYLQISIGEQPLFDESLLRNWLNGTQYHGDPEKEEAWRRIEGNLNESGGRALVMSQLRGKVVALFNVDYIARQVGEAGVEPSAP
jgi:hypothetical protein